MLWYLASESKEGESSLSSAVVEKEVWDEDLLSGLLPPSNAFLLLLMSQLLDKNFVLHLSCRGCLKQIIRQVGQLLDFTLQIIRSLGLLYSRLGLSLFEILLQQSVLGSSFVQYFRHFPIFVAVRITSLLLLGNDQPSHTFVQVDAHCLLIGRLGFPTVDFVAAWLPAHWKACWWMLVEEMMLQLLCTTFCDIAVNFHLRQSSQLSLQHLHTMGQQFS
jgi:hypothetical protein